MSEIKISKEVSEIKEKISKLDLVKVSELVKVLEDEYNIKGVAMVQPAGAAPESEKAEEKGSNVSLHILEVGGQPIQVYTTIKDVVNSAGGEQINIVKAKQMIDQKKPILENIPKPKAEEYKKQLEAKGAKVEIK